MVKLKTNKTSKKMIKKNSNQNKKVWIWNNNNNEDHIVFAWVRERNEEKKEKVIGDTPAIFKEYAPPIMDEKIARNRLRRWKPIFYCGKSLHVPSKVCGGSTTRQ